MRPLACRNALLLDRKILILMNVFGYIKHYQNWSTVAIKQNRSVLIRDFQHVLGCQCVLYNDTAFHVCGCVAKTSCQISLFCWLKLLNISISLTVGCKLFYVSLLNNLLLYILVAAMYIQVLGRTQYIYLLVMQQFIYEWSFYFIFYDVPDFYSFFLFCL